MPAREKLHNKSAQYLYSYIFGATLRIIFLFGSDAAKAQPIVKTQKNVVLQGGYIFDFVSASI